MSNISYEKNDEFWIRSEILRAYNGTKKLVKIPPVVKKINTITTKNWQSITKLTIPASVTKIDFNAFNQCTKIKEFIVDPENQHFSSLGGVLFNKNKTVLLQYKLGALDEEYVVPKSVEFIQTCSFSNCQNLKNLTFEDGSSMQKLNHGAFAEAKSIETIDLPNSILLIDDFAFSYCESLKSFNFPPLVERVQRRVFEGCSSLFSVTLNNKIEKLHTGSFIDCTSLSGIELPKGLLTISNKVFVNCSSLTTITIPKTVSKLGHSIFEGCTSLEEIKTAKKLEIDRENLKLNENAKLRHY